MNDQANAVFSSWLKVFLAASLAYILNALVEGVVFTFRGVLVAGLVAVLPVVVNWLDPKDTRYGRGYPKPIVSGEIVRGGYSDDEV